MHRCPNCDEICTCHGDIGLHDTGDAFDTSCMHDCTSIDDLIAELDCED